MTITKGMAALLFLFVIMTGFAGIGMLHILQITGLVKVQVSIDPTTFDYAPQEPTKKK
jgi:predicted lipid-binding transport protein (Tim44 family)